MSAASEAAAVIGALRSAHDDLAARVRSFSADDLARTSGASDWTVAQVLSHLGSGAVITLANLEAALGTAPAPADGFNQQVWARWDAMAPREQAEEFVAADRVLVERYQSIPAAEVETLRLSYAWLPFDLTLAQAARMRLNEVAMHSWDVRVAFDPGAVLASDATGALLHGEPSLVGRVTHPEVLDEPATVDVTTTDPDSRFVLVLGEQVSVDRDRAFGSDSTLVLPAESWLRLVTGRLADASGVSSAGPVGLDLLRRVFPGY